MKDQGMSTSALPPLWPAAIAQAAIRATQQILIVLDTSGTIRHVNQAAATLLRYPPDYLIGAAFVELLDTGSRTKGSVLLAQALDHRQTATFELNQLTGDGEILLIGYQATMLAPDPSSNGSSQHILLTGQPLVSLVTTTERLIKLNRRLKALFTIVAATSRSIVLSDLLRQALAVAISEFELLAGAIFLTDAPVAIDRPHLMPEIAPNQLRLAAHQGFMPDFVEHLAQPQPFAAFWNNHIRQGEITVVSGTGDEVGIQPSDLQHASGLLLNVLATPLISENQLQGWLYVVTDRYYAASAEELDLLQTIGNLLGPTVENARLYDALLQTGARLHAVLDGINSGVLLVDQEGIVRYANTCLGTLLNAEVRCWPGQPRAAVMPPTLVPSDLPADPFPNELWEMPGPQRRLLRRFADPIYDVHGLPLGSIEVYTDVTAIQEMNQLKDEFIAAAAHDLKTPVTAIKGYAQIATRLCRKLDEPRLLQQLAVINARSDELAYLMDALLDISRLQGGRLRLDLETFTIGEIIAGVTKHFDFDLARRNRALTKNIADPAIEVTWDRVRMEGVLINLIGNAIKYSPSGEEITVSARPQPLPGTGEQGLEITVTDHGIGIPPEERSLIFERFYRTRRAVEDGFKGTGIGLYISRRIVELHGGQVWAGDALHGGSGTTMYLLLPCAGCSTDNSP
jgi:two-component system phosphate regulon sensor histidine kinase PhoR